MNRLLKRILVLSTGLWLTAAAIVSAQQIAVFGEIVHTANGEPIEQGLVLIKDGIIEAVGPASQVRIPDNYTRYEAAVVTPGLIDAHSVVGLAGMYNVDHDQDQLERSSAIQPDLRAMDAYNAREELVAFLRSVGITTVHTGHGPGALISGQTMIVKTVGTTVDEALVDSTFALAITLGSAVGSNFDTPGTRSKSVAMLRQELIRAQEYSQKGDERSKDLRLDALQHLLEGRIYGMVTAHSVRDILTALRLQREFGFNLILDGASEAYLVIDQIKEAGVPVIIHPTMIRPFGDAENASFETAGILADAGIPVFFQSGYEAYVPKTRVALYEAAIAVANGFDYNHAIRSLTIDAAGLLGISERVGSLEPGKDADLVLFNGDPFEYITTTDAVIVNGQVVYERESADNN
ncbi:MAG: amidohydrolase family protein [Balneolaceae bacterium]